MDCLNPGQLNFFLESNFIYFFAKNKLLECMIIIQVGFGSVFFGLDLDLEYFHVTEEGKRLST